VHGRLRALVEAESLLNDSTAAVGFSVAIALAPAPAIHTTGTVQFRRSRDRWRAWPADGAVAAAGPGPGRPLPRDPLVRRSLHHHCCVRLLWLANTWTCRGAGHPFTARNHDGNLAHWAPSSPKGREAVVSFWDYARLRGELR